MIPLEFLDSDKLLTAAAAFIRVGGILFILPFFGDTTIPIRVKTLLAVAMSMAVVPVLSENWGDNIVYEPFSLGLILLKELFIGITIGFTAKIAFEGMLLASGMVAFQMGFGTSNLIAPGSDTSMDSFSALHRVIVLLLFLSLNLHHIFLNALVTSFELIPAAAIKINPSLGEHLIDATALIFSIAVQLAAPVVVALLFATAALGLIARTVPQMNVFAMSFPVNFFIGIIIYIASTPFFPAWMRDKHIEVSQEIFRSIQGMLPI